MQLIHDRRAGAHAPARRSSVYLVGITVAGALVFGQQCSITGRHFRRCHPSTWQHRSFLLKVTGWCYAQAKAQGGSYGGDAYIGASQALLAGTTRGTLEGGFTALELRGTVDGDVNVAVGGRDTVVITPWSPGLELSTPAVRAGLTVDESARIAAAGASAAPALVHTRAGSVAHCCHAGAVGCGVFPAGGQPFTNPSHPSSILCDSKHEVRIVI